MRRYGERSSLQYEKLQEKDQKLQEKDQALAERNEQIEWFKTHLSHYGSGRALFKALVRIVAGRFGLASQYSGRRLRKDILKSGLFEYEYYRRTYEDIVKTDVDPLRHYLAYGWKEGRDPSEAFSTQGYLALHGDVRLEGINPLVHYLRHGQKEGRNIQTTSGTLIQLAPTRRRSQMLLEILHAVARKPDLLLRFVLVARRSGLSHALRLASTRRRREQRSDLFLHVSPAPMSRRETLLTETYRVVPYYLNPYLQELPNIARRKVAVHLHLYYEDMAQDCIGYLNNIPVEFDLYVSIPAGREPAPCEQLFRQELPNVGQLWVESVPNRGRNIAPFIIQFGKRLGAYDYIGHFHTKRGTCCVSLEGGGNTLMDTLCGSRNGVAQIFQLLDDDAKLVYPADNQIAPWDTTGWNDSLEIARDILRKYSDFDIEDFPCVEFLQGTMFWAKAVCLEGFLAQTLGYDDFPEEPIGPNAALAHALERLIMIYTTAHEGRNYRLESPEITYEQQAYYEAQYDYSGEIIHDNIKVLAYYLPQFHPTPENDEWHGEGFTEWHKVRAANPLFFGHYQQHVPHPDIGYYHLDSPEQLEKQVRLMHKSGVHGLIFYHYWFSEKLILEKPAQMLLANPQIDMPFCFCWANENWTRRWDGNEREILLGQLYSKEDARNFIQYLMPFFKDERYIKVEGRPVLFVYRPSSIEDCGCYLAIWREECERSGVQAPYVVATLTRGTTSPRDYGMDAAVERVLHDWTDGAVPDISSKLRAYSPLKGSVLDYGAVANHYMGKPLGNDYPLFRSLVPVWDNTTRYGSRAYVLHGFTTEKMQAWMERLIRYTEQNLPADRRFVVVNAWNEWAEGAHLEPDTRFGYGYLNTIGRALCNYAFAATDYIRIDGSIVLKVSVESGARQQLRDDPEVRQKFLRCLANSSVLVHCTIEVEDPELADELGALGAKCISLSGRNAEFNLVFSEVCLFPKTSIEFMLKMAMRHQGFHVSASVLNDPAYVHGETAVNFEIDYRQRSGMELRPTGKWQGYKVCPQATCFLLQVEPGRPESLDKVSTIIRFHRGGNATLLENAIFSLLAQTGCYVQPCLAIQDMSDEEVAQLEAWLAELPWSEGYQPVIRRYASTPNNPDLRSLMLNDTLKSVGSGYAAFLDYDDILFPHAYRTLLERVKASGKNASFARVYSTTVDAANGRILKREKIYNFGSTYDEFLLRNLTPLHSILLNLDRIDLNSISYFDDMKYMEDYYLTLQLFTPASTDWASLKGDEFIGDYIHRQGDDSNTLAITDSDKINSLLKDEHYCLCEARICALRQRLQPAPGLFSDPLKPIDAAHA